MNIASSETLYLVLAFVVPGFVISYIRSIFITRRTQKPHEQVLTYLTLSTLNYAIFSWLVYYLINSDGLLRRPILAGFLWFIVILVGPALIGVFLGVSAQKNWSHRLLQKVGLRPVHFMPTAWDWQWSRLDGYSWVVVTLKDGSVIAGVFGPNSFASSEPGERDIYIEKVYNIPQDGPWTPAPRGQGVLIPHGEIRCVEFFPNTAEASNVQR